METKVFYISKNTALMTRWQKKDILFVWLKMYIFCTITLSIVEVI